MNKKLILIMSFAMISMHISGITDVQLKLNNDLLLAVGRTDTTAAKKLLDQGAKPRGSTKRPNDPSRNPIPLLYAITIGNQDMINLLKSYTKKNKSTS